MTIWREEEVHRIDNVRSLKATAKALLCDVDGEEVWVPQSQIHADSEVYAAEQEGTLAVTAWFAKQRGWL